MHPRLSKPDGVSVLHIDDDVAFVDKAAQLLQREACRDDGSVIERT